MKKIIWYLYIQFKSGRFFKLWKSTMGYIHRIKLKSCGTEVSIHPNVIIRAHENIEIGNQVSINHNSELYGGGGIRIGDDTMLSYYVTVLSDSRSFLGKEPLKSPARMKDRIRRHTEIGRDVWIGTKATIMPGVKINDHAIVAACSVVTKDVESWDIVAGNPAKKIGSRLDEPKE